MSPKRQVMWLVIIFTVLGVGVSVIVVAVGGGFSGPGPSILDPPTEEDLWVVGENIEQGIFFNYSLTSRGPQSSLESGHVSIDFVEDAGDSWVVEFSIRNGTGSEVQDTVMLSKQLTREGQPKDEFRPYFEPVELSVLAIRDMTIGQKYLVVGAQWDTITLETTSVPVKIIAKEKVQTPAGSFDSFVLSYKIGENASKIWLVKDMPLPVKAQVYDAQDQLKYSYELVDTNHLVAK